MNRWLGFSVISLFILDLAFLIVSIQQVMKHGWNVVFLVVLMGVLLGLMTVYCFRVVLNTRALTCRDLDAALLWFRRARLVLGWTLATGTFMLALVFGWQLSDDLADDLITLWAIPALGLLIVGTGYVGVSWNLIALEHRAGEGLPG